MYLIALQGDWGVCYVDLVYTRVVLPNEQHAVGYACAFTNGEYIRITGLGHLKYGQHPGLVHVDRGPGTPSVPITEFMQLVLGDGSNAIVVKPVQYYLPGPDYAGGPPMDSVSIFSGGVEHFAVQEQTLDPGRISGHFRWQATSTTDLNRLGGIMSYPLQGKRITDEAIRDSVAGVSNGYPPEMLPSSAVNAAGMSWHLANVTLLFGK